MNVLKDYSSLLKDQDRKNNILTFIGNFALFVKEKDIHHVAILSHDLVDIDGFSSAVGLKHLLMQLFPDLKVNYHIIFSNLNSQIQPILESVKLDELLMFEQELLEKPDLVILVDCNNLSNIDSSIKIVDSEIPVIIIDHHESDFNFPSNYRFWYIDFTASSNAEIILDFYSILQVSFDKTVGSLLLIGLITDTGQFKFANSETYIRLSALEQSGVLVKDGLAVMQSRNYDMSERIARIKSAMRVTELFILNEYIALISYVSSHQASAARGLLELGCDLSFIIAKEKPKKNCSFSISARVSSNFIKAMNFSAAPFLSEFFKKFDGNGGGHAGAAAGKGKFKEEKFLEWFEKNQNEKGDQEQNNGVQRWTEQDVINYIKSELVSELFKIGEWRALV